MSPVDLPDSPTAMHGNLEADCSLYPAAKDAQTASDTSDASGMEQSSALGHPTFADACR